MRAHRGRVCVLCCNCLHSAHTALTPAWRVQVHRAICKPLGQVCAVKRMNLESLNCDLVSEQCGWGVAQRALHEASQISCKQQHNRQLHSLGRLELCERESRGSAGQHAHAPAASELLASPHASLHRMRSSMRRRP